MKRSQFTFYASYYEAVKELPKKEQVAVMLAICGYALEEQEPQLTGVAKAIFALIRPTLDTGRKKAMGGHNGTPIKDNGKMNERCGEDAANEKEKEKENECCISREDKSPRFTPPTVEEVAAYCKERENDVDPQRFVDFYTAKGWLVGKTKMKDWKAAVRTWERTNSSFGDNRGEAPKGKEEVAPAPRHTFVRTGEWEGYWVDENGERIE